MAEIDDTIREKEPKATGSSLERYYDVMRSHDLTELEIREGTFYVKLSRAVATAVPVPVAAPAPVLVSKASSISKKDYHPVTSPLGGIFYRSPGPNTASFVKEGDKVAFGDVLCIVEAMKVMNEIRSDRPGIIQKIVAENGKPVSSGQELFQIEPLS
ncbi:MAG: acetyl-CoA carboxylase biotin carboxyl carrier protein [Elusimicrobia bacterium]|jgi:acetyl-CoA carboxylase biotin carboxyl carrier protein|nr:acetyl-CoA carboxylase biotin carboxyl carrier protein [Elusimicrobiota bacterium]